MENYRETVEAGGVIRNENGEYIVVFYKTYSLPKGHVEEGEDIYSAALREIREETGVTKLNNLGYLGQITRVSSYDPNERKTIHLYLFETTETNLNPEDSRVRAEWVTLDKLIELLHHVQDKDFIRENLYNL